MSDVLPETDLIVRGHYLCSKAYLPPFLKSFVGDGRNGERIEVKLQLLELASVQHAHMAQSVTLLHSSSMDPSL